MRIRAGAPSLEDRCTSALEEYSATRGEAALGQAYEFGRAALQAGNSLLELIEAHQAALRRLLSDCKAGPDIDRCLRAAGDFLIESASPYEMAYRGFGDSVAALRRLNEILEEEIKRIAHAVHDEAGQLLVAVHLALAEFARELSDTQQVKIGKIRGLLDQVERQIRRFSHELRPTILDDLGWLPAIEFLSEGVAKRWNLSISVQASVKGRLASHIEVALYRIIQEALTNVTRHARAKKVRIRVRRERGFLCCSIRDDGIGIRRPRAGAGRETKGLGLLGVRERLNALGGNLQINSARGRGTQLLIRIPVEKVDANSRSNGR
jgi:signal transduction histidine kinase